MDGRTDEQRLALLGRLRKVDLKMEFNTLALTCTPSQTHTSPWPVVLSCKFYRECTSSS